MRNKISPDAFDEMFFSQFARLAEQAGRYVGQLNNRDRETVLRLALDAARSRFDAFNPAKVALLVYWDDCLQEAVLSNEQWMVRGFDRWTLRRSQSLVSAGRLKVPSEDDDES